MDEVTIRRAVKLAEKPPDTNGRCEFGMGMKTSCCWLGDYWSIRTKQLGHPFEYFFEMDVTAFSASSTNKMTIRKSVRNPSDHYTQIEIKKLHREFRTRTLGKLKDRLGLMYQRDIATGDLALKFNGIALEAKAPDLLQGPDGNPIKREIAFEVQGHKVNGWVGLLAQRQGSSFAGFNLYRRGRLIMPNVKFYGPGLFPDVSTNVIHQRLTGALDLDTLPAVHLKNAIDLRDLQDDFESSLAEQIKDVRAAAIETKYSKAAVDQKLEHVANVIDQVLDKDDVVEQIQMADDLRNVEFPDNSEPSEQTLAREPYTSKVLRVRGGTNLRVYLNNDNIMGLYMTYRSHPTTNGLDVEINVAHPSIADTDDSRFDQFVELAILEAVSEWLTDRGEQNPSLSRRAREMKDNLMRSHEMQFRNNQ